jgi:hypothetical protein
MCRRVARGLLLRAPVPAVRARRSIGVPALPRLHGDPPCLRAAFTEDSKKTAPSQGEGPKVAKTQWMIGYYPSG